MPSGHATGARLVALFAVSIVAGLGVTGCGDSDNTKDQARHADAVRARLARLAREHRQRLRAQKLRQRRARQARARKAREQQQASSCGAGLVRQNGYCVVPQPAAGGGQTTTPSDQAPSVDSTEGQQKLKQDPDCKSLPPPPASYHGPVQC